MSLQISFDCTMTGLHLQMSMQFKNPSNPSLDLRIARALNEACQMEKASSNKPTKNKVAEASIVWCAGHRSLLANSGEGGREGGRENERHENVTT